MRPVWAAAIFLFHISLMPRSIYGADLTRIRALHMEGNWGGNQQGIKSAGVGVLDNSQPISAGAISAVESRGSFTDGTGATITNDVAQVTLTNVILGSTTLARAGFWIGRTVASGNPNSGKPGDVFLQFRPSLDSSLQDVPGFSQDVSLGIPAGSTTASMSQVSLASGVALTYVASVLAEGSTLLKQSNFTLNAPAAFTQTEIMQALDQFKTFALASENEYFNFLANENANWLGISVAIFNDSLADPAVRVKYRPQGDTSGTIYTFDDADLESFVLRAKKAGLHIYLTLAFEPSNLDFPPDLSNPACHTAQYKVNRYYFGLPTVNASDPNEACVNPLYWWWNPSHPSYSSNVAQFWDSYTSVAVKYGALCQQLGVELFSLGTETDNLFRTRPSNTWTNSFAPQLTRMVSAVRAVYSGLLTYDQLYSVLTEPQYSDGGAGSKDLFGDLGLDVVGVSAYFELAAAPVTRVLSVAELETAWDGIFQNYLVPLQSRNPGTPILFLEFGYTDDLGSPANAASNSLTPEPTSGNGTALPGQQQQQNIFEAFYKVDDQYNDLVSGTFIWGNQIFSDTPFLCQDIYFNLYCKPSAQTVASIYQAWSTRDQRPLPTVTGVSNAADAQPGVVPGAFFAVDGANFAPANDDGSAAIRNGILPAELDNVTVMVGGQPAYVSAITPDHIYAQAPDVAPGDVEVTVTTPAGQSAAFKSTVQALGPAFFQWPNNQPVATHMDNTIAAANGTFTGLASVPAHPGETIVLWGTGFGPTNPAVPAGQLPGQFSGAPTQSPVTATLNGAPLTVVGSAISAFPGVYQVTIRVPAIADGDYSLVATAGGLGLPATVLSVTH